MDNLPPAMSQNAETKMTYRPYYTERNAVKMKPLLDAIYEGKRSVFLGAVAMKCTQSAIQAKVNDALRWLIKNSPEREKYLDLRAHIACRRQGAGVDIIWSEPVTYSGDMIVPLAPQSEVISGTTVKWFDKFVAWATSAAELAKFDSTIELGGRVTITDDDERALIKFCAPLGMELNINKASGTFEAIR